MLDGRERVGRHVRDRQDRRRHAAEDRVGRDTAQRERDRLVTLHDRVRQHRHRKREGPLTGLERGRAGGRRVVAAGGGGAVTGGVVDAGGRRRVAVTDDRDDDAAVGLLRRVGRRVEAQDRRRPDREDRLVGGAAPGGAGREAEAEHRVFALGAGGAGDRHEERPDGLVGGERHAARGRREIRPGHRGAADGGPVDGQDRSEAARAEERDPLRLPEADRGAAVGEVHGPAEVVIEDVEHLRGIGADHGRAARVGQRDREGLGPFGDVVVDDRDRDRA